MNPYRYVLGRLEESSCDGSGICKRASDDGPFLFVQLPKDFEYGYHVFEITSVSRNGMSRQGRVLWSVHEALAALKAQIASKTWERDRHGTARVNGLIFGDDEFVAELVPGRIMPGYDTSDEIVLTPQGRLEFIAGSVSVWLQFNDPAEIARAKNANFAPGVKPAPGKGQMIADELAYRRERAVNTRGPDLGDLMAMKHGK